MFKLYSKFKPTGDQPQAIKKITENILSGVKDQVLLGVTGSGKTFTVASLIEKLQRPALVISHNKTLAAQLYQEFREFFPKNAVHYFVSYYDYYQPEAYIPQTDTYIEKDAKVNQEIDRLRHAAVQSVLQRKDTIVVASVSCIYNIGSPQSYQRVSFQIKLKQKIKRKDFLKHLTSLQYQRNDIDFKPGAFRVRGDTVEVYLVTGKEILEIEFFGDEIEKISKTNPFFASDKKEIVGNYKLYPAQFWVTEEEKLNIAIENIRLELQERLKELKKENKLLEGKRLKQRTNYDLEMLEETGYCHGIENYSRHLEFRNPNNPPFTLLDYLGQNFLTFIDESHITVPQLNAMYNTDKARKEVLIAHGFRLPSALDNRPLNFAEFRKKTTQTVLISATPREWEKRTVLRQAQNKKEDGKKYIVEQLIRPTGLLEPSIEIKPTKDQVKDLKAEIKKQSKKHQRVLAVTITKRLAEELSDYLKKEGIKTHYLHSEIKTLERPEILKKLRKGEYDAIVGINLLREGLDLPEVALVAILDADKEGFLRSETTLIQTMGRAARHPNGRIILYADKITTSMKNAIGEIERRRKIQQAYNKKHKITPKPIIKEIREWPFRLKEKQVKQEFSSVQDIKLLEKEMKVAAGNLNFERAAEIRDLIKSLKTENEKQNHN
jgi:excinuclease ABC subunit B